MSGFSLWLLVSIRHKCQAACSCFSLCLWKQTTGSGLTQTHRYTPLHIWHTHISCEGKPLSKSPVLVAWELFVSVFSSFLFIFLFNFHLISTCLYPLFLSLTLSLSLFRVLIGVLQFFWRHYKHHNSEHLPFSSLFIFLRDFLWSCSVDLKLRLLYISSNWQATEYITYA